MEALPTELLFQIAPYLSVKDLAACCAVSLRWRDVFGSDEIWKPHCDAAISKHLETTPCRLEPKFTSPLPEDTSLSPISHWRMAFMRETHLWRNWISGNYMTEKLDLEGKGYISFLNSNIFVMFSKNTIELMDTSTDSPLHIVHRKVDLSGDGRCSASVVKSDMIITVNCKNIVQVINVDLEKLTLSLSHSFCVDDSLERLGCVMGFFTVNTVFFGICNYFIYVWDLSGGKKLKTEKTIIYEPSLTQSGQCEDIIIRGNGNDGRYYYFIYNTKELTFWPLEIHKESFYESAIIKNFIAIADESCIKVYKYKTSQLVSEISRTLEYIPYNSFGVFQGSFMFLNDNGLQQFTPSSGSTRCVVKSDLNSFKPIGDKLIMITTRTETRQCQIWRIGSMSSFKTSMPDMVPFHINESFSKALLFKGSSSTTELRHFW